MTPEAVESEAVDPAEITDVEDVVEHLQAYADDAESQLVDAAGVDDLAAYYRTANFEDAHLVELDGFELYDNELLAIIGFANELTASDDLRSVVPGARILAALLAAVDADTARRLVVGDEEVDQ